MESRSAATGKPGDGAAGSRWLLPGNRNSGYWRVKVTARTSVRDIRVSPTSPRYCAIPPRQGWTGPTSAMRTSTRAAGAPSRMRGRPGAEPGGLELERHGLRAVAFERRGHAMLAIEPGQQQEVAAAPGAGHLAADRALAARQLVELVDARVRDAGLELLLVAPRLVELLPHRVQIPEQERLLHLQRLTL